MPVVVDGFDLVVRNVTIQGKFPGGMPAFSQLKPESFCTDGIVSRLSYDHPSDANQALSRLEALGFTSVFGDAAIDAVIVNATFGCSSRCDWIMIGLYKSVFIAWCPNARPDMISVPPGWSPNRRLQYMSESEAKTRLQFLRSDENCNFFQDRMTGKQVRLSKANGLF